MSTPDTSLVAELHGYQSDLQQVREQLTTRADAQGPTVHALIGDIDTTVQQLQQTASAPSIPVGDLGALGLHATHLVDQAKAILTTDGSSS